MTSPVSPAQLRSLYRRLVRLADAWPVDPLRPDRSFKHVLETSIPKRFSTPLPADESIAQAYERGIRQADAMEKLLKNTYKKEWPLEEKVLSPAKDPNYYKRMLSGLEEGAKDGSMLKKFFAPR